MKDCKINENIINTFKKVLDNNNKSIYLTEEEICFLVNEDLDDDDKFSYSTFKDWKRKSLEEYEKEEGDIDNKEADAYNRQMYKEISVCFKKAIINAKNNLFSTVIDGGNNWQSRSWIIERKFYAWNLRNIGVTTNKIEVKTLDLSSIQEGIKQ